MRIIKPKAILTCLDKEILVNMAIAFDTKIVAIDSIENLKIQYPKADILITDDILMPGFVNPHVHLEFSNNINTLSYNGFGNWLDSIMNSREKLTENINDNFLDSNIRNITRGGVTTIGAISSYGLDMNSCVKTNIKVIYFNEIIGVSDTNINDMMTSFNKRIEKSHKMQSEHFIPSIAIHSPYSVHKNLLKKVVDKYIDMHISAHFMESNEEREWIDNNTGYFKTFFQRYMKTNNIMSSYKNSQEFLNILSGAKKVFLTHSLKANNKDIKIIENNENMNIISCPISNRLLTNSKLNLDKYYKTNICFATDGLSSNLSLNMFSELRYTLMMYTDKNIVDFAKKIILSNTKIANNIFDLNAGTIDVNKDADFILLDSRNISLQQGIYRDILLHTQEVNKSFTLGKENDL